MVRHHKHHNFMIVASNSRVINDIPVLVLEKDTKVMWWLLHSCKVIPMRYTCSPSQTIHYLHSIKKIPLPLFPYRRREWRQSSVKPSPMRPGTGREGWQCTYPHTTSSLLRLLQVLFSFPNLAFHLLKDFLFVLLTLVRDYLARIRYSIFFISSIFSYNLCNLLYRIFGWNQQDK